MYTHNGLLYFHTQLYRFPHVPFDVDFITFKIVDKKVMKRTAIQEQGHLPAQGIQLCHRGGRKKDERTVFTLDKFTIPDDKMLVVELHEKTADATSRSRWRTRISSGQRSSTNLSEMTMKKYMFIELRQCLSSSGDRQTPNAVCPVCGG